LYENVQTRRPRRKKVAKRSRSIARRSSGGALDQKGLAGKIGAAAIGAVAAQSLPGLSGQVSDTIPVTYGALLGVVLIMNKRSSQMVRYAAFGMILGGGVVQWAESLIGPQLSNIGGGSAGAAS
jgi:hypothetical protein